MQTRKSPFKKKQVVNFHDNGLMTSSLRPLGSSNIQDERFLVMEKELKKLKKAHNELTEQYEKMKNISIIEKVAIQMDLHQANEKLAHLEEKNGMLMTKIRHLEKDGQIKTKSYQKPLERSTNKSVRSMKKSFYQNDDKISRMSVHLDTECSQAEPEPKGQLKTSRSNVESSFLCSISQSRLSQNDGNSFKIKFQPQAINQKPLISDKNEEQDFCCKEKCLENYEEIQYLREMVSFYGEEMDHIYIQLKFVLDKRFGLKDLADYKMEMLKLCEENQGNDFFYKMRPDRLMKKIQERVQEIMKNPKKKVKNQQLEKIKEKINKIIKNKEELEKDWVSESFDEEAGNMEIERIQKIQKELFEKVRESLKLNSQKENSRQLSNEQKNVQMKAQ